MKIEYEYSFGLPKKIVWKYIKDEKVLQNSLPGCKSFVEVSRGIYQAALDVKIGPLQDLFTLEIRISDEKPPSFLLMQVKGKGNIGEFVGTADLFIKDYQGAVMLIFKAEADAAGAIAMAGQEIINKAANKGLETFFQKAEKEIKKRLYHLKRGGR